MLKPFSASEAPHTMAESTEESNVLFKKEKKKTHGEMDLILSAQRKQNINSAKASVSNSPALSPDNMGPSTNEEAFSVQRQHR